MAETIHVHAEILEEMLRQARRELGLECCGLLAGRDAVVSEIFPAENALRSATAYEIAPQELFRLFRRMREEGLEHLGIYHSHPATENFPSPSDIAQSCYPEQAYFIVSPRKDALRPVRAYSIRDGRAEELEIIISNE